MWTLSAVGSRSSAQQLFLPDAIDQPRAQIEALAERLGTELLAANKRKPLLLDLTLPNDVPCPLGVWLADKISESLAQSYPELGVIPRRRWSSAQAPMELAHDQNQEYALREQLAQSLGAEILVHGNFAGTPEGLGITLLASDHLAGGASRFEALAEIPITSEMQAILTSPLPQRVASQGAFHASMAGIGSPICEVCPAPEYTYVAKAKKLAGVVIAQVLVARDGAAQNVQIVRAPSPALANAAMHTVRTWRFKPARDSQGQPVPVLVNVAVSFRLDVIPPSAPTVNSATVANKNL